MQSQGSTSTQPSFDSLSSSDSSLFSDSTEDDADVFLSARSPSVIIGGPGVGRGGGPRRLESPASRWTYNAFTDREEEEEEESERSASCEGPRLGVQGAERSGEQEKSPADLLFAKKCAELQGFVRPLLELLNGLKRGRFERGLTSFQQSVAIDRIQRIVGVLRRPNGGEKYLTILTQVEKMLKMWFPHVSPVMDPPPSSSSSSSSSISSPDVCSGETSSTAPAHRHMDQMHMPVKKRRLSWTESDYSASPPVLRKRLHPSRGGERGKQEGEEGEHPPPSEASEPAPNPLEPTSASQQEKGTETEEETRGTRESNSYKDGPGSEPSLTWVHASPIFSGPKSCPLHEGTAPAAPKGTQLFPAVPPPTSRGSPIMQDSSISSTTPYRDPKNQGRLMRSKSSQPVAGQRTDSATLETGRGPSQSPPVPVQPSTEAPPAPLET